MLTFWRMDFLTPSIPFIQKIQTVSWLLAPMKAVTLLGNEEFFLLLLPLIYWLINRKVGAQLGVLLLVSVCLNDIGKLLFQLPRPYWTGSVLALTTEKSFGFPSGHAQNAALLWPFVALQSKNKKLWGWLSVALLALISFSRIYLGAHYPLDILGGWLIGGALLLFTIKYQSAIIARWTRSSLFERFAMVFVMVGCIALAFALAGMGKAFEADASPEAYALANAISSMVARIAALTGLLLGLAIAPRFETSGSVVQKVGRLLLGLVGLAFFYIGLKKILPDESLFRFVRYFLTTFWVIFGVPTLFLKLGLAQREKINRPVD